MENLNNLQWIWKGKAIHINELDHSQLEIIYKFLYRRNGLIFNINTPIWRKHIKSLILANNTIYEKLIKTHKNKCLLYSLRGGKELIKTLNKTKQYERIR